MNAKILNSQLFVLTELAERIPKIALHNQDVLQDSNYALIKPALKNVQIIFSRNALKTRCSNAKIRLVQVLHKPAEPE